MCLLVNQKATSPALSDEWLKDFYASNSDGVGVMYADGGTLIIEKALPSSEKAFIKFYRKHIQGKACAYHLRMRTHGNTDLENCHPYQVLNQSEHGLDLWLMHNGILHTGNKADTTKSDTWHYIRDYLRPMLAANPDFAFHPSFAEIVGEHIGDSNKFVLMDNQGRSATINEKAGVYWAGLWLSNTYAWSASASALDKPYEDVELAKAHAGEQPVKYDPLKTPLSSYYGNDPVGYPDEMYDEIESFIQEMEIEGLAVASQVSYNAILDFIDGFGYESFSEIAYMALDHQISEEWFVLVMTNHNKALEAFPWLSRQKSTMMESAYDYQ